MTGSPPIDALRSPDHAQVIVPCSDLEAAIAFYTATLGFRLDMIMPADAPRVALLSGAGIALRLEFAGPHRPGHTALTLRLSGSHAWFAGFDAHELAGHKEIGLNDQLGSAALDAALADGRHQVVIESLLAATATFLDRNTDTIRRRVERESPC